MTLSNPLETAKSPRGTAEAVRGHRRAGTASGSEREARDRADDDPDCVGYYGKSTRALGAAVRERGRTGTVEGAEAARAAEEVVNVAFAELRAAEVSIAAACALTGRSRATHYRRADPLGAALGPVHGPARPRRAPPSTITDDERGSRCRYVRGWSLRLSGPEY
jgi:putative transposase